MNGEWHGVTQGDPVLFPYPREMGLLDDSFSIDESVAVIVPDNASESELFLARFLTADISDRYQIALRTLRAGELPEGERYILMGSVANYLVRARCARRELDVTAENPGSEGYLLDVTPEAVLVAGSDDRGAFYGLQSLRQLITPRDDDVVAPGVRARDWPWKAFRGLRLYLPGRENIPFFKRLIRDFAAYLKYNTLIIETNAAMRLDRHPELNAGWLEFARSLNYTRRSRPSGPRGEGQDSAHHDTGDFGIVEKEEVADIVDYAHLHGFEVIPEIPSLTHAYYLLTRHRELAEVRDAEWPDTYCPCAPEAYELVFDVIDEYLEVMEPAIVHIGHDEWRMPTDLCPKCAGLDHRELFVRDVKKVYDYLKAKGVRVAMWGDHLLESVRGEGLRERATGAGVTYRAPGALTPEQVEREIPKDILIFNWFWNRTPSHDGESNDAQLAEWGFEQVYGNLRPEILEQNYARRSARRSVLGGAASSWAATNAFNFGKDLMDAFVGCACLLWSDQWPETKELTRTVQSLMPQVRRGLKGHASPSEEGETVAALDIASCFNATAEEVGPAEELGELRTGETAAGPKRFDLAAAASDGRFAVVVGVEGEGGSDLPAEAGPIEIGEDATSLIFLHACRDAAANNKAYFTIYNFEDSADLLGWYEVTYEDGLVETIPLRYGVNIIEWSWGRETQPGTVCFEADPAPCGGPDCEPVTFFAYEWVNPRFGRVIRDVRLKGSRGFVGVGPEAVQANAVMLIALSMTKKRLSPASAQVEEDE